MYFSTLQRRCYWYIRKKANIRFEEKSATPSFRNGLPEPLDPVISAGIAEIQTSRIARSLLSLALDARFQTGMTGLLI
ncbi:hypothetical protein [Methylicorpusculum sp.]|uniref:hypothetical protein n=1 Tax=Methylicorpusculum sp. TaxID=2713644 RepID=UPI002724AD2F|nr:hypothetical protein [Methylicorpusculum sp.]MDO9239819.1 hypothetical protein [Methylicorpusculum sp.]MDP2180363.1 hypothetical protein [Methylicorpusculum sp.]MDP3529826.1 hypothetical protein [Methylicorpusculum sp.]